MSAIDTYLNYIATKDYARDVRTAIVNAIRECYSNTQNPDLREEAFINAIEAEIQAGRLTGLDLGDGDVTTAKIANGAVTREKLDPNITFDADSTLDETSTNAIQNKAVANAINSLNTSLNALPALTDDIKDALLACFAHVAWEDSTSGQTYYDALEAALEGTVVMNFLSGITIASSNHVNTGDYYDDVVAWLKPTSARAAMSAPIRNNGYVFTVTDSTKYQIAAYDIISITEIPLDRSVSSVSTAYEDHGYLKGSKTISWGASDSATSEYVWLALKKLDGTEFTEAELANNAAAVFTYTTT